ncbi:alpha/beta fold hydrolase [Mesorhizobium sp. CA8]|uniref:alpha/beta fold hydrolase n=1 Tax=Mesorhizobium sp. CA8 TaxID=2876637 RepID=UPI0021E21052
MLPLKSLLEGRAEMLFFDRPGLGSSERGDNETLAAQADTIAALMDRIGIEKAVVVAHSFGGAITTAFARQHPEKTRGLVFLAPATHPWPGGATAWYYKLTATPVIGWLFSETLAYPAGMLRIGMPQLASFRRTKCRKAISTTPRSRWCCGRPPSAPTPAMSPSSTTMSAPPRLLTARSRRRPSSYRAIATRWSMPRSTPSAWSATFPAPSWSGSAISATSRTGSRPTSWPAPLRKWLARRSTCR